MSLPREWSFQSSNVSVDLPAKGDGLLDAGGSLFSIHSAPVFELSAGVESPRRPISLVLPADASLMVETDSEPRLVVHVSSPETVDDDDNLLTISSLTARPLIAKSRELRSFRQQQKSTSRWRRTDGPLDYDSQLDLDGGYGWVIVCGAFFVQFWVAGLVKSYGVLYVEIMETYSDSSAAVASWIPAILSALCLALGESLFNFSVYKVKLLQIRFIITK